MQYDNANDTFQMAEQSTEILYMNNIFYCVKILNQTSDSHVNISCFDMLIHLAGASDILCFSQMMCIHDAQQYWILAVKTGP